MWQGGEGDQNKLLPSRHTAAHTQTCAHTDPRSIACDAFCPLCC